jgi:hypothetical protein
MPITVSAKPGWKKKNKPNQREIAGPIQRTTGGRRGFKAMSAGGPIEKGKNLAKQHKKKLGEKIGVVAGYASEIGKSIPTPTNIVRNVVSKVKEKYKKKKDPRTRAGRALGPSTRDNPEPRNPDFKKVPKNIIDRFEKRFNQYSKNAKKLSHGGEARVRGMGAAIKGGKFEGVF